LKEVRRIRDEAEGKELVKKEEDVITYALYPEIAEKFLKGIPFTQNEKRENSVAKYRARIGNEVFEVEILK